MTIDELVNIDVEARRDRPGLFREVRSDVAASDDRIADVERAIGVRLSRGYREFLRVFGGGRFGYATIFSADPESRWYLPLMQRAASRYLPVGLLAFSDDFCGGNYVLRTSDGTAQEAVYYWNRDGGESSTEFDGVIDFVARYAYRPA